MGRSLKKRKIKKTKRVKVLRPQSDRKKKKGTMKKWEWWLLGGAFVIAAIWVIILGLKGMTIQGRQTGNATPTAVETPVQPG